jgi:hypothetical protein
MVKHTRKSQQKTNSKESSIRRNTQPPAAPDDTATAPTIDRLEAVAGGADKDDPRLFLDRNLSREVSELDASTEEEIDALRVNLVQDQGESHTTDSSGRVVDDTAEEEIARFTEVGPMQPDQGVVSVEPGRDDSSRILRRHHPNTSVARAEDVVEGNLDEPRDEEIMERKVDEGTAA